MGDYVVAAYGGGAVMMVPAHDKRDYQFAKKYNLEIKEVVSGGNIDSEAYVDYGVLINSGRFNGLKSEEAIKKIIEWLEKKDSGKMTIQYKMRDWIFFPSALLGRADSDYSLRKSAERFRCRKKICR